MSKKLFLLDALALIYRAYYALIRTPRITSTGINTNAQFGFTNTLLEIIRKENPTHIAVCFDTHAPTERHTDFADYKANRQETPEDLLDSLPHIKAIIEGFNIPVIEYDGYEADDIIGTLAWQAADMGYDVYMVTPDKDYGQLLIHPNVFIWKPPAFGNKEEIIERFLEFKKPVVFGCEKYCSPDPELAKNYNSNSSTFPFDYEFPYLNSGLFIGYVWALRKCISEYQYDDRDDDQRYWTKQLLEINPDLIQLDYMNRLFLNTLDIDMKKFEIVNGNVIYKRRRPIFVHVNSSDKRLIDELVG